MLKLKKLMAICMSVAVMTTLYTSNVFAAGLPESRVADILDDTGFEKVSPGENVGAGNTAARLGMSEQEVLALYEEYLSNTPVNLQANNGPAVIEGFAQYAVDKGVIEDTPQQRANIGKAAVRSSFKLVVNGGNLVGYKAAAALLDHSLQDNPSNLSYSGSTDVGKIVAASSEYKQIVNEFRDYVSGAHLGSRTDSGSTTLNSTTDLHLAFNKVDYVARGNKNLTTGVWTLEVTFKDTYDFDHMAWSGVLSDQALVTIINNYADYAQEIGAIVPYDVKVVLTTTFTEN